MARRRRQRTRADEADGLEVGRDGPPLAANVAERRSIEEANARAGGLGCELAGGPRYSGRRVAPLRLGGLRRPIRAMVRGHVRGIPLVLAGTGLGLRRSAAD